MKKGTPAGHTYDKDRRKQPPQTLTASLEPLMAAVRRRISSLRPCRDFGLPVAPSTGDAEISSALHCRSSIPD